MSWSATARCWGPACSLLLAEPHTPIAEIDDNVVTVKVTDDQVAVRCSATTSPPCPFDNEGMFVGIITIDDAIDVPTDESTGGYAEDGRHSAG